MNNVFLLLFCISFLCIPFFILWALINLIRRKPAKKRFVFSGISALALIISTIGFGLTMDDEATSNDSVNVVSESPSGVAESPALIPTTTPTIQPAATAMPTKAPTPEPTKVPTETPKPTATLQPTAMPTSQPTEAPKQTLSPTETPKQQTEKTPEPQVIENPAPQSAEVSKPQSTESSSNNNADSGSNGNAFNTYDNPEQQQTEATYVLNTSTMKIHHPSCKSVKKIAPHNYATSNASLEELKVQNYTTCGNCFK